MSRSKYFEVLKTWVSMGYNLKRFAIGFSIDSWSFSLDFGPFWFGIEW